MRLAWAAAAALGCLWLAGCQQAAAPAQRPQAVSPFAQWASVVVGADSTTSDGAPTPIFDNARRDVAAALVNAGFPRDGQVQLSVNPGAEAGVVATSPAAFSNLAQAVTARGQGCLFYFSSHGSQRGITFGQGATLDPQTLRGLIDQWCGARPTVVMVSACYSGVFVPALAAPNRMVMTAARPDRTSFGCGGTDRYPYFDECVLTSMPGSADFPALAANIVGCIQRREQQSGVSPPSEPQLSIGDQIRPLLEAADFVDGSAGANTPLFGAAPMQPGPPQPQPGYS